MTTQTKLFISIQQKYGEILNLDEVAQVFKYTSTAAVRKAHSRGTLPVSLFRFPHKTGFYAFADDVAKSIANIRE